MVRMKREGDGGTPAGRFSCSGAITGRTAARPRRRACRSCRCGATRAGARTRRARATIGRCGCPPPDCTDEMWRDDHLYDLTFVLDQNFSRRAKGQGERDLLPSRAPGIDAYRRLRCDFGFRYAKARSKPCAGRSDGNRVVVAGRPSMAWLYPLWSSGTSAASVATSPCAALIASSTACGSAGCASASANSSRWSPWLGSLRRNSSRSAMIFADF